MSELNSPTPQNQPVRPDERRPDMAPQEPQFAGHCFAPGFRKLGSESGNRNDGICGTTRRPFEVSVLGVRVVIQDAESDPKLVLLVGEKTIGSIPFDGASNAVVQQDESRIRYRGWDIFVNRKGPARSLELAWHVNLSPSLSWDWIWRAAVGLLPVVGGPPAGARLRLSINSLGAVSGTLSQ